MEVFSCQITIRFVLNYFFPFVLVVLTDENAPEGATSTNEPIVIDLETPSIERVSLSPPSHTHPCSYLTSFVQASVSGSRWLFFFMVAFTAGMVLLLRKGKLKWHTK
jgi:hypothetical protein